MSVTDDLKEALRLLETNGWRQRSLGEAGGSHCAAGAIIEAVGDLGATWVPSKLGPLSERYRLAVDCLLKAARPGSDGLHITSWNDAPRRTFREVKAAFKKAIASGC